MAGYVIIVHRQITDKAYFAQFLERVWPTVDAHGGRHLVRSGDIEVFDGDLQLERLVVIEFDSVEQARTWLLSPEHAELKAMRVWSANASVMLVPGV